MALLDFLRKKHKHDFYKPIVSKYVSFYTRNIIYECDCGERVVKSVTANFDTPFPITTSFGMTITEFNNILNYKNESGF